MNNLPRGQILPGSVFGDLLTGLAKEAEVIVEVGTWYGEGSTLCLYRGLVRETQRLFSFDVSEEMALAARSYYSQDPRVTIVHGSVRLLLIPPEIDLLLIDGGDDSGEQDFHLLGPISKVVALDDTAYSKNAKNADFLRFSPVWETVYDASDDRNGCGVWKRK